MDIYGWKIMDMDNYGWKIMDMDNYGWKIMDMDNYGWIIMDMDNYGWIIMDMDNYDTIHGPCIVADSRYFTSERYFLNQNIRMMTLIYFSLFVCVLRRRIFTIRRRDFF